MAVTVVSGSRGTATEKTSDQTLALTPSGTLSVGNYGLLFVVIDNTGTAEGQTTDVSATDTVGNTWTRVREQTEANTAALTGATVACLVAEIEFALGASNSVNIALAANATAKGAGLAEVSVGAGKVLNTTQHEGTNEAAATSYSVFLSGLASEERLYIGMAGAEEEVDTAVTLDAAYAEIGFGSIGSGTAGLAITNVRARVGTLSETSTGQTFDATGLTSADRATILIALEEDDAPVPPPTVPASPPPFRLGRGSGW
jgi:hypothetical protein